MRSKRDPSKWELHQLYSKHSTLRKHLPPTSKLTSNSLSRYLRDYKYVYIKGNTQHTGSGIIKAWKTKKVYRFVRVRGKEIRVDSVKTLYRKIQDGRSHRSILVQKAIDLATINGRPFTIRLMLMRDGKRNWQYAGMLAKVSGKDSIISNVRRGGGYATTIEDALARSLDYGHKRIKKVKRELIDIGFDIIRHATKNGYRSHETGIDLGIDKKGKVWIIEVNLSYPSYGLFNRLKDKTYYHRIKRLASAYRKKYK